MENQPLSNVNYIQKNNLYKIDCSTYTANNAKSKKGGVQNGGVFQGSTHLIEKWKWSGV